MTPRSSTGAESAAPALTSKSRFRAQGIARACPLPIALFPPRSSMFDIDPLQEHQRHHRAPQGGAVLRRRWPRSPLRTSAATAASRASAGEEFALLCVPEEIALDGARSRACAVFFFISCREAARSLERAPFPPRFEDRRRGHRHRQLRGSASRTGRASPRSMGLYPAAPTSGSLSVSCEEGRAELRDRGSLPPSAVGAAQPGPNGLAAAQRR